MKSFLLVVTLLAALARTSTSEVDVYQPGPYSVKHNIFVSLFTWGLDHNVEVWAPEAEGNFPVIYFIPGLAGKT